MDVETGPTQTLCFSVPPLQPFSVCGSQRSRNTRVGVDETQLEGASRSGQTGVGRGGMAEGSVDQCRSLGQGWSGSAALEEGQEVIATAAGQPRRAQVREQLIRVAQLREQIQGWLRGFPTTRQRGAHGTWG